MPSVAKAHIRSAALVRLFRDLWEKAVKRGSLTSFTECKLSPSTYDVVKTFS